MLWENDDAHRRKKLEAGTLSMDGEALSVGTRRFPLADITNIELVRRNLLVFSTHDAHYQVGGEDRLNTRKYMQLYRIRKGKDDV